MTHRRFFLERGGVVVVMVVFMGVAWCGARGKGWGGALPFQGNAAAGKGAERGLGV